MNDVDEIKRKGGYFSDHYGDKVDREEINSIIEFELSKPQRDYGDDYVEYDETVQSKTTDISKDIDLMLLEIEEGDEELGNPFGEDIESDNEEDDGEYAPMSDYDDYEFDDLDPEIFRDPTLMVKWLQRQELIRSKRENQQVVSEE